MASSRDQPRPDSPAADSGSVAGALHRGWVDVKSMVTGKDEEAVLNEAERGEDHA